MTKNLAHCRLLPYGARGPFGKKAPRSTPWFDSRIAPLSPAMGRLQMRPVEDLRTAFDELVAAGLARDVPSRSRVERPPSRPRLRTGPRRSGPRSCPRPSGQTKRARRAGPNAPWSTVRNLFQSVKQNSYGGQINSGESTVGPTLNFYIRLRLLNGRPGPRVALQYRAGNRDMRLFLNWRKYEVPERAVDEYRDDLGAVYGGAVNTSLSEPTIP